MPEWTEKRIHGISYGEPTSIPLTVSGGDHPGAILIALHAPRALAAYLHHDELGDLSEDELYSLLNDVRKLAAAAESIEQELIVRLRGAGASWATLGAALDVTRSAAREKFGRIEAARERGLNLRGTEEADERPATEEARTADLSRRIDQVIGKIHDAKDKGEL